MKPFTVAILGCGTVGSGVAKILLDLNTTLAGRAARPVVLKTIVDLLPAKSAQAYGLPLALFSGGGKDLTKEEASSAIADVINDAEIDLVVETIGGTSDFLHSVMLRVLNAKKHLVTANKAMLAEKGNSLFAAAKEQNVTLGYEASVCGAIPVIKAIRESFTGDEVLELRGIMNGTSNYILSRMQLDGLDFQDALALAQKAGYAEADPFLDISGGDAAHKLVILMKLAFGADVCYDDLKKTGIQTIAKEDIEAAAGMGCSIKLICYAKTSGAKISASVVPMMVPQDNVLSTIHGATNCVEVRNRYSGKQYFIGAGAGSLETASSIVGDIVFAARYGNAIENIPASTRVELVDADDFEFPYAVTLFTDDRPGIAGSIASAIGSAQIDIDSVSRVERHEAKGAFSVVTKPCTLRRIKSAIEALSSQAPEALTDAPKIIPILR